MASGKDKSSDGDEKNPFSFQHFVKKKSNGDIDSGSSDDESSNDNQKLSSESASQKDENNPYSFRKFLVKDAPPSNASPRPAGRHNFMPDTHDSIPDITSGLPDFVQDQAHHDSARRGYNNGRIRSANDLSLPDFVIGTNDVPSTADSNSTYSGVFPSINAIGSLIGRDEGPLYSKNRPSSSGNRVRPGAMPFLESVDGDDVLSINDDSAVENQRLREENAALRRQLLETRDLARHESERVAQLVQQVKALQNHEADETAALEKMVQKIESNLETATERAVKAESVIAKQKQEIKLMREQLKNSEMMNGAFSEPMDEVRDRTRYMSQQLAGAASNAEVTLKQMMSGVENLKLMSEIILSIGKIYEDPEEERGKSDMKQEESTPKPSEKPEESKPKAATTSSSSSANSQTVKNSKTDKSKESTEDVRPKSKVDSGAKKKSTPKPQKERDKIQK